MVPVALTVLFVCVRVVRQRDNSHLIPSLSIDISAATSQFPKLRLKVKVNVVFNCSGIMFLVWSMRAF